MRKIAVVTGTRAEYGLLYWIIKGILKEAKLELQLIVTGTHLSHEFGLTVNEIENDGVPIAERVEMILSSDSESGIASSMGIGMTGFAKAYERLRPDILLVLGDRFEIFAAVAAAVPFRIPVAHIHGGETTTGAMDELFRHAITKMSHIHFPSTEAYSERVMQMGERPGMVFPVGAPGLDNIKKQKLLTRKQLAEALELPLSKKWGIVTYHPATLEKGSTETQIEELLKSLDASGEVFWVVTMPNADTDGRVITRKIASYIENNREKAAFFTSLGQLRYTSMLKYAEIMVGNSSSGIIEAPSFGLPVVNIGSRQDGRTRAENVVDVPKCKKGAVVNAINLALSDSFRESLKGIKNPYGKGDSSRKIVSKLKSISLNNITIKEFHDIPARDIKK